MNKIKIRFRPRWDGPIEGHAVNSIRRLFPMLCAEHEFDDLMQEAYIVFMRCKTRYTHIDNPAWFMAIFSQSLRNTLLKLAAKCGRTVSLEELPGLAEPHGGEMDAFAAALLGELPDVVKRLIHAVCFGPGPEGRAAYRKLREYLPTLA